MMLRLTDVTFSYPSYDGADSSPVLRGVNLEVPAGEIAVVVGPPDSGKTTLARVIAGLAPRHTGGRLGGTIAIDGGTLGDEGPQQLMDRVGIVFQDSDEQIITSRCAAEVAFPLESLGVDADRLPGEVCDALEECGLGDFREREPSTLSGGEKKRLLLSCLVAVSPKLWILDETVDELDVPGREWLFGYLARCGITALLFSSRLLPVYLHRAHSLHLLHQGVVRTTRASARDRDFFDACVCLGVATPAGSHPEVFATPGETLLEADRVEYRRPAGFRLQVESFRVRRGEILGIVGPNGSGKTTLARVLCGLERLEAGEIRVRTGETLESAAVEDLRRRVAYVFQNPDYQIFLPTVREELEYRPGRGRNSDRSDLEDVRERFKLPSLDTPPTLMSYGARKRLQVATCYLLSRSVVILDEADAGLSVVDFADVVAAFVEQGRGIVVISHDAEVARRVCTRLVRMREGRLEVV